MVHLAARSKDDHDHAMCIARAMDHAHKRCADAGTRLTPTRRRVLELIWQSHQPSKAYGILEQLQRQEQKQINPPTVYRALDFLLDMKLIHRIQALNAFIGCSDPSHYCGGCLMICDKCHRVYDVSVSGLDDRLAEAAAGLGFEIKEQTTEVFGRCATCVADGGL